MQGNPIVALRIDIDSQIHLPTFGELDGVPYQIHKDLSQPSRVSSQAGRKSRQGLPCQFKSLQISPGGKCPHGVAERILQVEFASVERKPPGIDLGEIQDVIDHGQEGTSGLLNHVQVLSLLTRKGRVEGQIRHANDPIHGSPDLMAHHSQELTLGSAGSFGGFLGLPHFLLCLLAAGNVADDADDADDLVVRTIVRAVNRRYPPRLARLLNHKKCVGRLDRLPS